MNAHLIATGSELAERDITNEALSELLGLSPEQILKSSGIRSRRWAEPGTTTSSLACSALRQAMDRASISSGDIDYLILGTMTPDRFIPGTAPAVQHQLGLSQIPSLDIRAACCNMLYALQLSSALIRSGTAKVVAVCLSEVQSKFLDVSPDFGTTSMLFGDGAAALLLSCDSAPGSLEVLDVLTATDGSFVDDLGIRCPGTEFGSGIDDGINRFPRMNGQSVILQASRRMVSVSQELLKRNGVSVEDVSWIVPHQANANLLVQVARGLGVKDAAKVFSIIEHTGNTSSASMGIALDQLREAKLIREGDLVLMPAFAAGFTWGAALCRA